jgi:hypothetical protein
VTALEAIKLATGAGLMLEPVAEGLRVRGPKRTRVSFAPVLGPLVDEILTVLACPTATRFDRPACDGCGRVDWIVTVIMDDGERFCSKCLMGRSR